MNNATCYSTKNGQPLQAYFSKGEALDAADYVKRKYGSRQEPYECPKCGHWHLSPKERQTPSKACIHCVSANKALKDLYATREAAKARADIIERERGVRLGIYKCPYQDGYHLTQNSKRR